MSPRYDLTELARRIQQNRLGTAPVSFSGFDVQNTQSILESGVEFRQEVPEADKRRLIWHAISEAASHQTITADVLEAQPEAARDRLSPRARALLRAGYFNHARPIADAPKHDSRPIAHRVLAQAAEGIFAKLHPNGAGCPHENPRCSSPGNCTCPGTGSDPCCSV